MSASSSPIALFSFLLTPFSPVIGWSDALNTLDNTIDISPVRKELERAESYKIEVGFLKGSGPTIEATVETVPGTAGLHMHTNISDVGMGWGAIDGAPLFCVGSKKSTDMQLCQHTIINGTTILKHLHTSLYIDTHAHEHDMHINEMWIPLIRNL